MTRKKKTNFLPLVFIILLLGGFFWWHNGTGAVNTADKTNKIFIVRDGAGVKEIAKNLKSEHLIRDPLLFYFVVKFSHLDNKIQHGDFRLSPSMNAQTIARNLTHGSLDAWITIPEGKRAEEIADILKESVPSYETSWRDRLIAEEGYLFPDTYLFPKDATIDLVISQMKDNFTKKYTAATAGSNSTYTEAQIVIIASIIEREAGQTSDRPMIASVIENRLAEPMRLQIDATVQYALGYNTSEKTWWKKDLTYDDLTIPSAYNTYTHDGIPPGPISNPGEESLSAAANPAKTNYLFYLTDKKGITHFARTSAEHNANIQKYGL